MSTAVLRRLAVVRTALLLMLACVTFVGRLCWRSCTHAHAPTCLSSLLATRRLMVWVFVGIAAYICGVVLGAIGAAVRFRDR